MQALRPTENLKKGSFGREPSDGKAPVSNTSSAESESCAQTGSHTVRAEKGMLAGVFLKIIQGTVSLNCIPEANWELPF